MAQSFYSFLDTIKKVKELIYQRGYRYTILKIYREIKDTVRRNLPLEMLPYSILYFLFEVRAMFCPRLSDANPLDLRWVDPSQIKFYHNGEKRRYGEVFKRRLKKHPFFSYSKHRQIKNHYSDGIDWEDTQRYKRLKNHRSSEQEVKKYIQEIEKLHKRIKEDGYKTQKQLLKINPKKTRDKNNDCFHPILNEIGVSIDAEGNMSKVGSGGHRLAIVKLLEIDRVPVIVRSRSIEWQRIRNDIRCANCINEVSDETLDYLDHPDLKDIVPSNWLKRTQSNKHK